MKRRNVLAGIGAAAVAWPLWVRRASADRMPCDPKATTITPPLKALVAAWKRATQAHMPLLVIIAPTDPDAMYFRGQAWGALINHGSEEDLAPFGLVEVACATMDELKRIVPQAGRGEPLFVIVETASFPAIARAYDFKLGVPSREDRYDGDDLPAKNAQILARLLRSAVARDAERARRLDADPKGLAAAAMPGIREHAPPGAHWANASGCGVSVEPNPGEKDDDDVGMLCGMGHVPEQARRFLLFYSEVT